MISSHKIHLYIITIELSLNTFPLKYTYFPYTYNFIQSKIRKTQLREITLINFNIQKLSFFNNRILKYTIIKHTNLWN